MTDNSALENQLAAAFAKRGDMNIGTFIQNAIDACEGPNDIWDWDDDDLLLACEQYVKEIETGPKGQS